MEVYREKCETPLDFVSYAKNPWPCFPCEKLLPLVLRVENPLSPLLAIQGTLYFSISRIAFLEVGQGGVTQVGGAWFTINCGSRVET